MPNRTDHYAVFGNPIEHSKSPQIHAQFAAQVGHSIEYVKQLIELDCFNIAAADFFKRGGLGLNITVPFKLDAYNFADSLTERARCAGAVNTLIKAADNTILGDNTDGTGLVADLVSNLAWPLRDKNIMIIGAGGAVRGVLLPLLNEAPASIVIANRTAEKAEKLAHVFKSYGLVRGCGLQEIGADSYDIIINATSASLGGELPAVPSSLFSKQSRAYDMVYSKTLTPFLQLAKECGVQAISDGLGMLVGQAAESFKQWRHVEVNIEPVLKKLRSEL
ncbi:MAG: shikimate dehydrogenase [Lentisphaeria bacterium]|jgi:shikimate dehydrogenase